MFTIKHKQKTAFIIKIPKINTVIVPCSLEKIFYVYRVDNKNKAFYPQYMGRGKKDTLFQFV